MERLRSQYWSKKYTAFKERVSLLTCSQISVIYAVQNLLRPAYTQTHISFKSSLSSNHLVCLPFLYTVLSSLSSKVTVPYTTRGQVNCPCKVFFSYLEFHLLSYSLPVHVALLCGPRFRLACYLVPVSIFIPLPLAAAICCLNQYTLLPTADPLFCFTKLKA